MKTRSFVLASCLFVLGACGEGDDNRIAIPMGAVMDQSFTNAEASWVDSVKLAEYQMNAALKNQDYKNIKFKFIMRDSANIPAVAEEQAVDLARNEGCKALILDTSSNTILVGGSFYDENSANDLGVPVQCSSCTSGTLGNPGATDSDPDEEMFKHNPDGWFSRTIMSTALLGRVHALAIRDAATPDGDMNGDGTLKVVLYGSDESFGRGAAADLRTRLEEVLTELGGSAPTFIFEEVYHPPGADPNSYTWGDDISLLVDDKTEVEDGSPITDVEPDHIIVANFGRQQAGFIKAYKATTHTVRTQHYQTLRFSTTLQSVINVADGLEGVSHINFEGDASGNVFKSDFESTFGAGLVYRNSIYYDNAVTLMLRVLLASASLPNPSEVSGTAVRDAISSLTTGTVVRTGIGEFEKAIDIISSGQSINYEGASGPIDYDAYGNVKSRVALFKVIGGQFVDVAKYNCIAADSCPNE